MSVEERMELLERTILGLEQDQRGLLLWGLIFAIAIAILVVTVVTVFLLGSVQRNKAELVLRRLVIQDENGRERIVLDADERGAAIQHYDANGKKRIVSATLADGPASTCQYDDSDR